MRRVVPEVWALQPIVEGIQLFLCDFQICVLAVGRRAHQHGRAEDQRLLLPGIPRLGWLPYLFLSHFVRPVGFPLFHLLGHAPGDIGELPYDLFVTKPTDLAPLTLLILKAQVVIRALVFDRGRLAMVSACVRLFKGFSVT